MWFAIERDFEKTTYIITGTRYESIMNTRENILITSYTTAKRLSKLAVSIMSTKFVLGYITLAKSKISLFG